jgi:hypothetical protein
MFTMEGKKIRFPQELTVTFIIIIKIIILQNCWTSYTLQSVFWVVTLCSDVVGGTYPEDHNLNLHHCENLKSSFTLSTVWVLQPHYKTCTKQICRDAGGRNWAVPTTPCLWLFHCHSCHTVSPLVAVVLLILPSNPIWQCCNERKHCATCSFANSKDIQRKLGSTYNIFVLCYQHTDYKLTIW